MIKSLLQSITMWWKNIKIDRNNRKLDRQLARCSKAYLIKGTGVNHNTGMQQADMPELDRVNGKICERCKQYVEDDTVVIMGIKMCAKCVKEMKAWEDSKTYGTQTARRCYIDPLVCGKCGKKFYYTGDRPEGVFICEQCKKEE